MSYIRSFQSLHFPWRFNDRSPFTLLPLTDVLTNELQVYKQGFITAFRETLCALEENDTDFLKSVMEPRLYPEVHAGLDTLKRRGHSIKRTNTDQFIYAYYYNDRIYQGVNIDRSLNKGKEMEKAQMMNVDLRIGKSKEPRMYMENMKIFTGKDGLLTNNLIFKVDVVYNTAVKLIVLDENGEKLIGDQNKSPETHKFRFETMTEMPSGVMTQALTNFQIMLYYLNCMGTNPIKVNEWIITDIDDHLKGNPFIEDSGN
ncbi:unnamed protein product [Blepharisma stoltei]|uniref:Uncharacterized protein n=1 Tax=Blepharisma stoltei TaxID=1481888 RepID=A0AAU9JPT7_9CILI|nr:unnamed protein product [Blepharisma stoltei]